MPINWHDTSSIAQAAVAARELIRNLDTFADRFLKSPPGSACSGYYVREEMVSVYDEIKGLLELTLNYYHWYDLDMTDINASLMLVLDMAHEAFKAGDVPDYSTMGSHARDSLRAFEDITEDVREAFRRDIVADDAYEQRSVPASHIA